MSEDAKNGTNLVGRIKASFPEKLLEWYNYVIRCFDKRREQEKLTKPPYNPNKLRHGASSTDPLTWSSLCKACEEFLQGRFDRHEYVIEWSDAEINRSIHKAGMGAIVEKIKNPVIRKMFLHRLEVLKTAKRYKGAQKVELYDD